MAIHVDPNKYPIRLCFSQECPVIDRNFSGIIFLTIHSHLSIIPMRTFNITLITSLLLIIGGFITPPIGQIDGSVLTAIGLLVLFATVEKIPEAIKAGRSIKVQKGNFCAEIEGGGND